MVAVTPTFPDILRQSGVASWAEIKQAPVVEFSSAANRHRSLSSGQRPSLASPRKVSILLDHQKPRQGMVFETLAPPTSPVSPPVSRPGIDSMIRMLTCPHYREDSRQRNSRQLYGAIPRRTFLAIVRPCSSRFC